MAIRDILLALAPRDTADPARDYALAMAAANRAHVTAASYPIVPDVSGGVFPEFVADLVSKAREDAEAKVKAARERFERQAMEAQVNHSFRGFSCTRPAAIADFTSQLRTADLAILTQHSGDVERHGDLFIESALFRSGRPIIVVPFGYTGRYLMERVLVAWDGSVHAARALAGAMPLLAGATIEVFSVEEASKGRDLRGDAVVEHLRRHGLAAGATQRRAHDVSAAIAEEANSLQASMVVMGGYGHSRFREFIFGGATRLMLSKMAMPVLMAH